MTIFVLIALLAVSAMFQKTRGGCIAMLIFTSAALMSNIVSYNIDYGVSYFMDNAFIDREFNQVVYCFMSGLIFFCASEFIRYIKEKNYLTTALQLLCFAAVILNIYGIVLWAEEISLDSYVILSIGVYVFALIISSPLGGVLNGMGSNDSADNSRHSWYDRFSFKDLFKLSRIKGKTGR